MLGVIETGLICFTVIVVVSTLAGAFMSRRKDDDE